VLTCISGLLKPKTGAVTFGGRFVTATSPRAKLGLGLVHVPQDHSLFPHMTVWDNLLMGGYRVCDHHAVKGRIEEAIGTLAASGRTVLLVEQDARSGLAAPHVGAVLEAGVVRLYLGGMPRPLS
jgi:ABC-type branched-subunit amino acid transport system ATPase component